MRYRERHEHETEHRAFTALSVALVAVGIALRVWQYAGRSALWTDEATLANNVVARSAGRLMLEPLAHNQAAPVGFLLIEKLAVTIGGANELALRAWPLCCALLALVLFWRVARRVLAPSVVPLALAPFALAPALIFHAAEAKQYSSDMAIALALLAVALALAARAPTARGAVTAAVLGAFAPWLSQPAVLVIAGLSLALLVVEWRRESGGPRPRVTRVVCAWVLSAAAVVAVSEDHLAPASHRFLTLFWSEGFWPMSLHGAAILTWPFLRVGSELEGQLSLPRSMALAGAALVAIGAWGAWRRDRAAAAMLAAPLFVTLGASAARLYPFSERLVLFLVPSLLLLMARGVTTLAAALRLRELSLACATAATLLFIALGAHALREAPPVYRRENIAPALDYLRLHAQPSDARYVYYGAVPAFEFYAARDRLDSADVVLGGCHRSDARAYLAELDALRGRPRVWLLFAHELPRLRERALMLGYLDAIGSARDSVIAEAGDVDGKPSRVYLYRYDLSDSARLAVATARDFSIAAQPPMESRLRCQNEIP